MAEAKKYPTPQGNPETAPFWEAAKQGKFLIKRCTACGEPHYFPRSICPFCFSDKTVWEESSGEATIYTFSLMRKSPTGPLRDRLRHAEGRPVAADQHRRLRHGQAEDRPEGEGGVQADRRRAAAVLHAGVDPDIARACARKATGGHPRESGDPVNAGELLDARFRGE